MNDKDIKKQLKGLSLAVIKKIRQNHHLGPCKVLLVNRANMLEQGLAMSIFSHAIEEEKKLRTSIFAISKNDLNWKIYESFGFNVLPDFVINKIFIFIKSIFTFFHQIMYLFSLRPPYIDFEKYVNRAKFKGIPIGDLVYDSYIRNGLTFLNLYRDIFKFFRLLARFSYTLNHTYGTIKSVVPECIVVSHIFYASQEACMTRIGLKFDVPVYVVYKSYVKKLKKLSDALQSPHSPNVKELKALDDCNVNQNFVNFWQEMTSSSPKDNVSHDAKNAYSNKAVISKRSDFLAACGIERDDNRCVILVAPHSFSDVCRGEGAQAFFDYYQWFLNTVQLAKKYKHYYWVFKPHPSSHMYGEEGIVEKIVKQHESDIIRLVPDSISTKSVFSCVDLILTVRGSIALEATCQGVPVIQCGSAPWTDYVDVPVSKNPFEYENFIKDFKKTIVVPEQRIKKARIFTLWYLRERFLDSNIFPKISKNIEPNMDPETIKSIYIEKLKEATCAIEKFGIYDDPLYKHYLKIIRCAG